MKPPCVRFLTCSSVPEPARQVDGSFVARRVKSPLSATLTGYLRGLDGLP